MKQRGKRSVLKRVLLVLLVLLLLAAAAFVGIPMTENVKVKELEGSDKWMADLDDSLRLNEIVLPGAHDAATQYVRLAFFSKCQALSVGEQLTAGVRYLDIRLGLEDEGMKLMHGFVNCKEGLLPWADTLRLEAVLEQCYAFLKAHPTETVVFAVKHEHGGETARAFAERLESEIGKNAEQWYLGEEIPSLGEVRGKLVLMRRYLDESLPADADCAGIPFFWKDQKGREDLSQHAAMRDNGAYRLWVQDRFEYGTEDKWSAFVNGLKEPGIGAEDLSVHFLSTKGTLPYGHPYLHAASLNDRLQTLPSRELRGWIILDFVDAELAKHIYSANFQQPAT